MEISYLNPLLPLQTVNLEINQKDEIRILQNLQERKVQLSKSNFLLTLTQLKSRNLLKN